MGSWFGKDQRNTRDYFLGGKDIPWWGIGLSIVAAETSALTVIGVPAICYGEKGDLSFVQLIIGYVIARIILAVVMVPLYLKGEKQNASLEVVGFQVGHLGQNLRRIKPGREQVQNVADTNSHPPHARPSAALPGIDGNSLHQVLHIHV